MAAIAQVDARHCALEDYMNQQQHDKDRPAQEADRKPPSNRDLLVDRIYDNLRKCAYLDAENRDPVLLLIRDDVDRLAALAVALPEIRTINAAGQENKADTPSVEGNQAPVCESRALPNEPAPAAPLTGDTPRTDAALWNVPAEDCNEAYVRVLGLARQLERELTAARRTGAYWHAELIEANKELHNLKENTKGVLAAWKRDYDGERARGDAWMADCKKAEAELASVRSATQPCEGSKAYQVAHMEGKPLYVPVCGGHAEGWFTRRDHLRGGMDAECVVCAFVSTTGERTPCEAQCQKSECHLKGSCAHIPEGCTPADAAMLRKGNHALADESHRLQVALANLLKQVDDFCAEHGEANFYTGEAVEVLGGFAVEPVRSATQERDRGN